jgi:hypothetical protein
MTIKTAPGLRTRNTSFQSSTGGSTSHFAVKSSWGGSVRTASNVPAGTSARTSMASPWTTRTFSDAWIVSPTTPGVTWSEDTASSVSARRLEAGSGYVA